MSQDRGVRKKREAERRCALCRRNFAKKELIRLCRNEDGSWRLDLSGKAQGRGAYSCREMSCLEKLLGHKSPLKLDEPSRQLLAGLCEGGGLPRNSEAEIYQLLGLARRAGSLVPGYDATVQAMRAGELALALMTEDAGEAGKRRLQSLAGESGCRLIKIGGKAALGECLGRGESAFCGITDTNLAAGILRALKSGPAVPQEAADEIAEE